MPLKKLVSHSLAISLALGSTQAPAPWLSTARAQSGGALISMGLDGARAPEQEALAADYQRFFKDRMGFADYSAEAVAALKSRQLPPLNSAALEFNAERLKIVNHARDLAVEIIVRVLPRFDDPAPRAHLTELAARFLALQPLPMPDEFPAHVKNIKDREAREEAKTRFLIESVRDAMEKTRTRVVSDILHAIYGEKELEEGLRDPESEKARAIRADIALFERLVEGYVEHMYLDMETGQTRYLGRALALGLLRHARKSGDQQFESGLAERALRHGEFLSNYVSDTVRFIDKSGETRQTDVRSGDFVLEYSGGIEARRITSAVVPTSLRNRFRAFRERLIANLVFTTVLADESELVKKQAESQKLSLRERLQLWATQQSRFKKGYSHAAVAAVYSDPETGLKHAMVYDNYPNAVRGGMRWIGIHDQFAADGPYSRFGLVRYDAKKFLRVAKEQAEQDGGLRAVVHKSDLVSGNGAELGPGQGKTFSYKPEISARDFDRLVSYPEEKAGVWFETEIAPRVVRTLRHFMTRDGMAFADGFKSGPYVTYCSETADLAFRIGTGLNTQTSPDRWKMPLEALQSMGLDPAKRVDVSRSIISPNTFVWQDALVAKRFQVTFPDRTLADRRLQRFEAATTEMNRAVTRRIARHLSPIGRTASHQTKDLETGIRAMIAAAQVTTAAGGESAAKIAVAPRRAGPDASAADAGLRPTGAADDGERIRSTSSPEERLRLTSELREYLMNLGFADHVAKLRENLNKGNYPNEVSRQTIVRNMKSYEAVNAARELGLLIMAEMNGRLSNAADRERLVELTARMMALQPMNPPREIPHFIKTLPEREREKALESHVAKLTSQMMEEHSRKIVSDIVTVLYGEKAVAQTLDPGAAALPETKSRKAEISRIYALASTIVDRMYMDMLIGQTRYFGRALSALLLRQSRQQGLDGVRAELNAAALRHDVFLDNFVGEVIVAKTEKGIEKIPVENFSMILTRSIEFESSISLSAVLPANEKKAREWGLVGHLSSALFPIGHDALEGGYTGLERLRDRASQLDSPINSGFSHVAYTMIKRDPKTGDAMTWIIDNFPHPARSMGNNGAVRLIDIHQSAPPARYSKFGVARYDHKRLHAWAQETVKKRGYPQKDGGAVFPSEAIALDGKGMLTDPPTVTPQPWRIKITKAEFLKFHAEPDPEKWYGKYSEAVTDRIMNLMYEGTFFGFKPFESGRYYSGSTYCSQLAEIASLQVTGVSVQKEHDRFTGPVRAVMRLSRMAKKTGIKKAAEADVVKRGVDLAKLPRIIAPTGLVAQDFVKDFKVADFPNSTIGNRVREWYAPYQEMRPDTTRLLKDVLGDTRERFASHKMDPSERSTLTRNQFVDFVLSVNADEGVSSKGLFRSSVVDSLEKAGNASPLEKRIAARALAPNEGGLSRAEMCRAIFASK